MKKIKFFCDFDGTITKKDSVDYILNEFADKEWNDVEREWKFGLIGSAECMKRQISMINATKPDIDSALDDLEIDKSFVDFAKFCAKNDFEIVIISDGVNYFIKKILENNSVNNLQIISNSLVFLKKDHYQLELPYYLSDCNFKSGVCKCQSINEDRFNIYIGNGQSDFCPAKKADLVFAKDDLADFCSKERINFYPYSSFSEIISKIEEFNSIISVEQKKSQ